MAVQTSYPGVYVQEVPSGVRTIAGVSTSVAIFIGRAPKGTMNDPVLCLSYTDFEKEFSGDNSLSDMPQQVKLFFINGGTKCYVSRIANGATQASSTLLTESAADALTLTAKQSGLIGESIRAVVTYKGPSPENTFNIELFRWETNNLGQRVKANDNEYWQNLSMDPRSPLFAPNFLSQKSKLVEAALPGAQAPSSGSSTSGLPVNFISGTPASKPTAWATKLGSTVTTNKIGVNVDGKGLVEVDFSGIVIGSIAVGTFTADLAAAIKQAIEQAYITRGILGVTVTVSFQIGPVPEAGPPDASEFLKIVSAAADGYVLITPAGTNDLSGPLMLGTGQGGLEIGPYASFRPAPTGFSIKATDISVLNKIATAAPATLTSINLDAIDNLGAPVTAPVPLVLLAADTLGQRLQKIKDAINDFQQNNVRNFFWKAELWGSRLAIIPTRGDDNFISTIIASQPVVDNIITTANFNKNVFYYSVGNNGSGAFQTPSATKASDGTAPELSDYDQVYLTIEKEVDLFNLMILPKDKNPPLSFVHEDLYGPASSFCEQKRAFLLMDPPDEWTKVQEVINGISGLRVGLSKKYSAVFYPRISVNQDGIKTQVGPSGAMAGLIARTDASRGVWKAPAGTEADLRGIIGLEYKFSDQENGVLNPVAINTLRIFPSGIVNWGARTMDGDNDFGSEWKYIPVRRTALFIEESLYRGLKWVVFEPNDEPLWAQIRLNVGAFMHNLFRQGAFQGIKKQDAYFVKCDSETTTQNDINLGMVNIWVGFAPLKPAEFVILYLQQMTGQIQV
ncbi:MAG: phage tail sheath C-terminal domain-containing protein [Cyclobacteriaceae bacterium]